MPDVSATDLAPTDDTAAASAPLWRLRTERLVVSGVAASQAARRRLLGFGAVVWWCMPERTRATAARLLDRLRPPPIGAGELLVVVPVLLEPARMSAGAVGRLALAALTLGLVSGVAGRLGELELRPEEPAVRRDEGGRARPAALRRWASRAPALGLLALALVAVLVLGLGFAVVAVALLAVQGCRAVAGARWAAVTVVMAALAVVLRVDAGAVTLGTATNPPVLLLANLFGLFVGLCQHRERLVRAAAPRGPRWWPELVRRYLDVVTAALLCGLIVAYVLVVGRDPATRAAAGAWAYLSAPFVLGGLLRCWHLTVVEERPVVPRGGAPFGDPWLAFGALGGAAVLAVAPHL